MEVGMRLVTYRRLDHERLGFINGNEIFDPLLALGEGDEAESSLFANTISFIRSGPRGRSLAEALIAKAPRSAFTSLLGAQLGAPIRPSTILCSGSNYQDHNREKANTAISGKEPEFFVKTADCVIGPEEPILHDPALTQKLDCETELAVVIGKAGRHIPVDRALEHVFGYTIVNDVTARDRQVRTSPEGATWYDLGRGKSFDTSAPLGPNIVTADEVGDPQALQLRTRINGELRQASTTANMIWTCADLIHFFSISFTLRPGMVIITGTPGGTAWSADASLGGKWHPQPGLVQATRYCQPGDVVESEVEKIGVLRNPIADARTANHYLSG
jgi:2-keto-4-pentenoate hydratase/2-oxohepta-3-ene-1,7-dioic acid hydratase in catechol pathway